MKEAMMIKSFYAVLLLTGGLYAEGCFKMQILTVYLIVKDNCPNTPFLNQVNALRGVPRYSIETS